MIFCGVLAAGFFVWQMQKVQSRRASPSFARVFFDGGCIGTNHDIIARPLARPYFSQKCIEAIFLAVCVSSTAFLRTLDL